MQASRSRICSTSCRPDAAPPVAPTGITQQDFRLSELMAGEGLAVVVVVNKWDKVDQEKWTEQTYKEEVKSQLRQVNWAGVVCTTAVKGMRRQRP